MTRSGALQVFCSHRRARTGKVSVSSFLRFLLKNQYEITNPSLVALLQSYAPNREVGTFLSSMYFQDFTKIFRFFHFHCLFVIVSSLPPAVKRFVFQNQVEKIGHIRGRPGLFLPQHLAHASLYGRVPDSLLDFQPVKKEKSRKCLML